MPDWSYRTVLQPLLFAAGRVRAQRIAVGSLAILGRSAIGLKVIDFLGHMRPDARLSRRRAGMDFAGPVALGSLVDPSARATAALSRFGAGLIECGPVREQGDGESTLWQLRQNEKRVAAPGGENAIAADELLANLAHARRASPLCIRIAESDPASTARVAARLADRATLFSVDAEAAGETGLAAIVDAARAHKPVLLRIGAADLRLIERVTVAMHAGAAGAWLVADEASPCVGALSRLRGAFPEALFVAGGVLEPGDARDLLDAGADLAAVDAGLVFSGPGLVKRCNEALLSLVARESRSEPLSLDAARTAWFWGLVLGAGMLVGGLLALVIASTRVVLPYDEALCGLTRDQMARLNPRLLPFMAHDRVSLAGTMISVGIFYAALAWSGVRRGEHWAHVTILSSATAGFFTFFLFLGFGYFDPFHAFVTTILTQFTLLCAVMHRSERQISSSPEWRETASWRRAQWGQLLFVIAGVVLTGAGAVLASIGSTFVFVDTDLEFLRTTAARFALSYDRLVPLVAHDRASLGGMLIANGLVVLMAALWGFHAGARWLWRALAWGGNIAFACATLVHLVVGYVDALHLAPALIGWSFWNLALLLTRSWMHANQSGLPRLTAPGSPQARPAPH